MSACNHEVRAHGAGFGKFVAYQDCGIGPSHSLCCTKLHVQCNVTIDNLGVMTLQVQLMLCSSSHVTGHY